MTNLTYNGQTIEQRDSDGYLNGTQMCNANGKLIADWLKTQDAKRYIDAISTVMTIPATDLIIKIKPNVNKGIGGGTWIHPKLAIKLARWISVDFELWCDEHIKTLIETGQTRIDPLATKPGCLLAYEERVLQIPQRLRVPDGYWTVLEESAYLLLHVEQVLKCPVDRADLLDGSIGIMWGRFRQGQEWAKESKIAKYQYPDGRWCSPNCYEWSELGFFRGFMKTDYTRVHLPRYLDKKYPGLVKL